MADEYAFFATTARNLELLLAEELQELGAKKIKQTVGGVHFYGSMQVGYRAVLWSRLANSILLPITSFAAATPEALYDGVRSIGWDEHLSVDQTFAVKCTSQRSQITHTRYGALKVKDAVVDQFREALTVRPSVDVARPDVRINCHLDRDRATLSIDLSGRSLHRRGYRKQKGKAPLKENVAAAVLMRAGWPRMSEKGARKSVPIIDPMCGSGTLLIEAAMMAADIAPGLHRDYFGFLGWRKHRSAIWENLLKEAHRRKREGLERLGPIRGSDINGSVISDARKNVEAAGLQEHIHLERRSFQRVELPRGNAVGLLVSNVPYGERMGNEEEARQLHAELGAVLKERFHGWRASILTGSKEMGFALNLRADKYYSLYNGSLECVLLNFDIYESK